MKKHLLLTVYAAICINTTLFAQGNGSDGVLNVSTTVTINTTKSNLTAGVLAGATTINIASSTGFTNGSLVLLIQMYGSNQGMYEFLTIASNTATSLTFTTPLTNIYYSNVVSAAQVIKVPQYTNVTINSGGILTAPAWDGSTGGILTFYANGTLNIKAGGKIDATGLGFTGGIGGSGGAGGTGGAGGQGGGTLVGGTNGLNGGSVVGGSAGGTGGPVALGLLAGGTGGNGGGSGSNGTAGNVGTPGNGPGSGASGIGGSNISSNPNILLLGGGGGGGKGGDGTPGAGGGGGGGSGTLLTMTGGDGTSGGPGGNGGAGGNGGSGGGIILVKSNTLIGGGSAIANGNAGGNGIAGSPGGAGGNGGAGGESLIGIVPLNGGGGGGGGKGAKGGTGGGAGGGGGSGVIYIYAHDFSTWTGTVTNTVGPGGAIGAGGTAGTGGAGGAFGRGLNILGIGSNGIVGTTGTSAGVGTNGPAATLGIAAIAIVLPVELVAFTAEINDKNFVSLNWSTTSEKNSDYFSIQRSRDGKNFTEIDRVKSKESFNGLTNYIKEDAAPLNGTSYYRLASIGLDGSVAYSEIRSVSVQLSGNIAIYPNPAEEDGTLYLRTGSNEDESFTVNFYNMQGEDVYSKKITSDHRDFYTIDLPNSIAPGTYHIVVNYSTGRFSEKIVVK